VDTLVDFPDRMNVRGFIAGPQGGDDQIYRLFAVSNHMGGLSGGHYTAHAIVQDPRFPPDPRPKWFAFNDAGVAKAAEGAWRSAAAYVLFYERITGEQLEDAEDDEA
jgi:ubiquitin carboxyl-terminal hydrolase 4/11/15